LIFLGLSGDTLPAKPSISIPGKYLPQNQFAEPFIFMVYPLCLK